MSRLWTPAAKLGMPSRKSLVPSVPCAPEAGQYCLRLRLFHDTGLVLAPTSLAVLPVIMSIGHDFPCRLSPGLHRPASGPITRRHWKKLPRYPTVPVVRMGRLAVDQAAKGQEFGRRIAGHALTTSASNSAA
jgi:hypothetical protein